MTLQRKIQPKLLTTIVQVHLNLFFLLLLQAQPGFHKQGFPQQHLSTTTEKKIFCRKLGLGKNEKLFFVNSLLLMVRISNLVPWLFIHRFDWWSAARAPLNYFIHLSETKDQGFESRYFKLVPNKWTLLSFVREAIAVWLKSWVGLYEGSTKAKQCSD